MLDGLGQTFKFKVRQVRPPDHRRNCRSAVQASAGRIGFVVGWFVKRRYGISGNPRCQVSTGGNVVAFCFANW